MRVLLLLFFFVVPGLFANPIGDSKQIVVSLSPSWSSPDAEVYVFEKVKHTWQPQWHFPSTIGKKGLGWGQGLHSSYLQPKKGEPIKHEGDKKAPAGVFRLVETFGYATREDLPPVHERLPAYHQVNEESRCVDDFKSRYYNNQVYDQRLVKKDWDSHEELLRKDELYKLAIVVDHNQVNVPDLNRSKKFGSCIFLHLWRGPSTGTAGCTAFSEENMLKLLSLLDASKNPVLVQFPKEVYQRIYKSWELPELGVP